MRFENSLHYSTFADRSQVENRIESYDTLVLPSHLLVGGKKAVPSLVHRLVEAGEIEYYINPSLTEFHRGTSFRDSGEIKSWHQKLVNELGSPLDEIMTDFFNLDYFDLTDTQIREIAGSVASFQESFVQNAVEEAMDKYESALAENISPRAVIPWYLKIRDYDDLHANEDIIEKTSNQTDFPIKPCIHVNLDFLGDIEVRNSIIRVLLDHNIQETFLWVDNLDKSQVESSGYVNVIRTVSDIAENEIRPHFLYGDFFSNLLSYFGLQGTGYGTYHSEHKEEKLESAGGGNLQRYYLDPTKEFFSIPDAVELATTNDAVVPDHSGLMSWGRLPKLGKDHDFLKNHFIRTKLEHKRRVLTEELDDILDELEKDYETYRGDVENLKTEKNVEHLSNWVKAIQKFEEDYPDEYESAIDYAESISSEDILGS